MSNPKTVVELIRPAAGEAVAIAAPERSPLTFSDLRSHVEKTVTALNQFGIGRVLPIHLGRHLLEGLDDLLLIGDPMTEPVRDVLAGDA